METVIGSEPICKSGVVQITCHHSVHRLKRENGWVTGFYHYQAPTDDWRLDWNHILCTSNIGLLMFPSCRDSNRSLDIFDEKKHPLSVCWRVKWLNYSVNLSWFTDNDQPFVQQREKVPDDYSVVDPEHKLIYRFIRTLFSSAQLTAECAIVTLVSLQCTSQIFGWK